MMQLGVVSVWTQLVIGALAVYATLALCSHSSKWLYRDREARRRVYFVVVTANAERDIEGVLRKLAYICRDLDADARIVVVDAHSIDLTMPIVKRFSMQFMPIECVLTDSYEEAMGFVTKLEREEHAITCVYQLCHANDAASFAYPH